VYVTIPHRNAKMHIQINVIFFTYSLKLSKKEVDKLQYADGYLRNPRATSVSGGTLINR